MSVKSKKQKKKNIIGWTVFLAALVAFFFAILGIVKLADSNVAETASLFDWDEEDILRFSYNYEGETYSIARNDEGNWVYEENDAFPLSQTYAGYLTSYLASLTSEDRVSKNQKDLDSYGLSEPSLVITVENEEGDSVTYSIGDEDEESGDYYLIRTGDEAVYLVSNYVWSYFGYDIKVLAELEGMPDMTTDSIESMTLTTGDGSTYSLLKETVEAAAEEATETVVTDTVSDEEGEYSSETVLTEETDESDSDETEETLTAFETAVDDLYYYWSYYSFEDFKSDQTMLATGLSAPDYTLLVRYEDGTSFELKIGDETEDDLVYATSDEHTYIYSIDDTLIDIFETDFINQE